MAILETARLKLPLLAAGQAHKELFHNEALTRIDHLIHPAVQAIETDPAAIIPVPGQCWIVGSGATDEWLGHDDEIAGWTGNGWLYITPLSLMRVYIESTDSIAVYRGSWQLASPIESPVAGVVVDVEARSVIDSILAALEAQGIVLSGA
ncbi:DUF2793 domain-containing protein [uncultured Parasphingorhabdus sp.]|uniref:DUF2793 domain-containing protein n=1 Tax=uncultured Parasphingorhabdus sp. TaxID=2709694 RepID=UPI0030DC0258|tara:strand:+ start:30142 stop:30591 length:450 start_codon:yes stop_codon:yes gene_type:complete